VTVCPASSCRRAAAAHFKPVLRVHSFDMLPVRRLRHKEDSGAAYSPQPGPPRGLCPDILGLHVHVTDE